MIVDSLHYWVQEMHVDGFRFDLASILARDSSGAVLSNPPVLWDIESDPALAGTKMIAEAWDAAGLYQVGNFAGDSWKEWNDRFRDDIRDFFRGKDDSTGRASDRLLGSPGIYGWKEREVEESINFVTCHDGFTLNDLVSYNHKRNEENGEDNRDGRDDNRSWNCGVEGPAENPVVEKLRNRQVKNFFTVLMAAGGVPMFVMGDEARRSQRGNNNAYCQDNETSWLDWDLLSRHADLVRFVRLLIKTRLRRDVEHEHRRATLQQVLRETKPSFHGVKLNQPDWSSSSHSVAIGAEFKHDGLVHIILNAYWEPLEFELPALRGKSWRRWIDTALDPPDDICERNAEVAVEGASYRAAARSVVILVAPEDQA
jgi:glycogen operon protein